MQPGIRKRDKFGYRDRHRLKSVGHDSGRACQCGLKQIRRRHENGNACYDLVFETGFEQILAEVDGSGRPQILGSEGQMKN